MNAVNTMAETYNMPVLYSCHPRSQKMIEKRGFKFNEKVIQHKPLGFFDYNKLQQNAFCVVSDSGTVPEEGAFFGFPAVSIRTSTERPEALEAGNFILAGISTKELLQATDMAIDMKQKNVVGRSDSRHARRDWRRFYGHREPIVLLLVCFALCPSWMHGERVAMGQRICGRL